MQKLIAFLLFIFCAIALFGQKCEYVKNESDKFTGKQKVYTKATLFIEFTRRADIYFGQDNDTLGVVISYVESSPQPMETALGATLSLSLTNGTVLTVPAFQAYQGRVRATMDGGRESVIQLVYAITKEQLEALSRTAIAAFKFGHRQGVIQRDVGEKQQQKIMTAARCLFQLL